MPSEPQTTKRKIHYPLDRPLQKPLTHQGYLSSDNRCGINDVYGNLVGLAYTVEHARQIVEAVNAKS